ncbi:unnamed protein product [Gongylonema pulchrum]|uniref:ICA69 domain-containing protein n=1 Tax=Gongylonema pulchrum TaxID=637853 RepID=A0A183CVW5_9BILA|nr:unnamed protein product [Gongylonema pulchrum]
MTTMHSVIIADDGVSGTTPGISDTAVTQYSTQFDFEFSRKFEEWLKSAEDCERISSERASSEWSGQSNDFAVSSSTTNNDSKERPSKS